MKSIAETRQRGVALLLSLGVLSLLLVTGIAFVSNALLAQRSAAAYRFRTQSQLLGKSSVNRVMMLMRYYLHNGDAEGIGELKSSFNNELFLSGSTDVPDAGKNDQLAAGANSLLTAKVDNAVRNAPAAEWEYLWDAYDNNGRRTADAKLLGRFAYWVLPAGSVNFSEILRGNPNLSPTNTMSTWTKRRGFGIRELNRAGTTYLGNGALNLLDDRFASESVITADLRHQDSPRSNDYVTFQSMFDGKTSITLTERNVIRRFLPPAGTEEEVYLAVDGAYDKSVFNPNRAGNLTRYHRFDLTRTDWDKLGNASAIPNSDALVLRLLGEGMTLTERAAGDSVTETTETTADSIPALRRIGDTKAAYPSLTLRRKQIAANLIDYCDADDKPTSDSTDWETSAPNYTGNEKTPYLNEVMISPSIAIRREEIVTPATAETPAKYAYKYTGQIGLRLAAAEVVNIYEASAFPGLNISLEGEYTVEVSADKDKGAEVQRTQTFTVKFSVPFEATTSTWTVPDSAGRYAVKTLYVDGAPASVVIGTEPAAGWTEFTSPESTTQLTEGLSVSARITKLKISKIHLKTASGSIDYVRDLEFAAAEGASLLDTSITAESPAADSTVTLYPHLGCEVDDPRENLYQGDKTDESLMNWKLIKVSAAVGTLSSAPPSDFNSTTAFSFGLQNNFCKPENDGTNAGRDLETATRPENVSSVHLRNNAMRTPVELGAIPRGAKWETINLRASRVTPAMEVLPDIDAAGDTYQQGDAAILDQVKLTPRVQVPHRLCINTPPGENTPESKLLYEGLFRGLVWNWDFHYNYDYAGTAVSDAAVTAAANVLAKRDVSADSGAQKFFSRAELIDFTSGGNRLWNAYGHADVAPTTDAQAETIPVLVSGLVSFFPRSPDPVSLILAAQSIRDVGTPAGFSMTKLKSDGTDNTETATVTSGKFDLENGTYFDEITGTVRYYAEIGTNASTKKVVLFRIEPLD